MDSDELDLIVENIYSDDDLPTDWDKGFSDDSSIRRMTDEVPFKIQGQWFLYVWDLDKEPKDIAVYSYSEDRLIDYNEFHRWLESAKTPVEQSIKNEI